MPKAQKTKTLSSSRWVLRSVVGLVLVFASFAVFQMVSAQTSGFKDPSCNPLTNAGDCTPSGPLLLSTGTTQELQSNIDIGKTGNQKILGIYGTIDLYNGSKLQTQAPFTDQAINVASTGKHAIVGTSSAADYAGIYGFGSGAAATNYGVAAYGTGGPALYAEGTTAAKLKGKVVLADASSSATLSFSGGNLDFQTADPTKGLTVNGTPVAGGGVQKAQKVTNVTGVVDSLKNFDVKNYFLGGNNYEITSVQVLYDDINASAPDILWVLLPQDKYTYKECTGALGAQTFSGILELKKPIANALNYRIVVTYDPQSTFICDGADSTAPTSVTITVPPFTNPWWYGPNIYPTGITDDGYLEIRADGVDSNGEISRMDFYDTETTGTTTVTKFLGASWRTAVANPAGIPTNICNSTNCRFYWHVDDVNMSKSYPSGVPTHSIFIKAFNVSGLSFTSAPVTIKTFKTVDNRISCHASTCAQTTQYCCSSVDRYYKDAGGACHDTTAGDSYSCTSTSTVPGTIRCGKCSGILDN